MFDGSTYYEDHDSTALVDGGANGFSNTSPSNIALGTLSPTASACEDEFVSIGAVSAIMVDAVRVRRT
nr:hypothetical protein [Tanacetum cinerariifolium]